jgi:DNA-binding MarR family transcriptional regulator
MARVDMTDDDYRRLLTIRWGLRRFLHWSEQRALEAGLTPAQHQLLLAIRGHPGSEGPTIGHLAEYLMVRHHSAVGLVDRAAEAGLVERQEDAGDRRVVRVHLTDAGRRALEKLSPAHLQEVGRLLDELQTVGVVERHPDGAAPR